MEKHQELEWTNAQKIVLSVDLLAAAKQHLQFLAAVDRNRSLYGGPALDHAIYRYKYFWLPLLAKHATSEHSEVPLVVPFDCEWIWHCHRLNPVRYLTDCKQLYGRILDCKNVVSSVLGTSTKQTEEIWNKMYPTEPYEHNLSAGFETVAEDRVGDIKSTDYDLIAAVKRQKSFYYQVGKPHMNDDLYLEGAVARYKGYLHLIKINKERNIKCLCVPIFDIDLIWHTHQLHPTSYCKDVKAILGKVLQHNDTDSDRTKGGKLDTSYQETVKLWEETFGLRYMRAGAIYRGTVPMPIDIDLRPSNSVSKKAVPHTEHQTIIQLPRKAIVEVMVEIVGVKNLPTDQTASPFVYFRKKQPDVLFNTGRRLDILSPSGEKSVAVFQCEPNGELLLQLISNAKAPVILGTTLISLENLVNPDCKLYVDNWFELKSSSEHVDNEPISLRVALSSTTPYPAPHVLHMVRAHPLLRKSASFFPLPERVQQAKSWTCIVDDTGNEVINIQMRDTKKSEGISDYTFKKEVIGMTGSGETHVLAENFEGGWRLMDSQWFFQLKKTVGEEDHLFELLGTRKVIIVPGRKLGYEIKNYEMLKHEKDFMTMVEFSAESPYGKAVALVNLKNGFLMVEEQWLALPGITLAFILSEVLKTEGLSYLNTKRENPKEANDILEREIIDNEKWNVQNCNGNSGGGDWCNGCGDYRGVMKCHFLDGWNGAGFCQSSCTGCAGCKPPGPECNNCREDDSYMTGCADCNVIVAETPSDS